MSDTENKVYVNKQKFLKLLLVLLLMATSTSQAADQTTVRIEDNSIIFEGSTTENAYQKLVAGYNPKIKTLIINSGGGDIIAGMKIGQFIRDKGLLVEVRLRCNSSCANYIFTSAKGRKLLDGAAVCFHGDASTTSPLTKLEFQKIMQDRKYPDDQIELGWQAYQKQNQDNIENERRLYTLNGFDLSHVNDGKKYVGYDWVCPTQRGFQSMGIKDVVGEMEPKKLAPEVQKTLFLFNGLDVEQEVSCGDLVRTFRQKGECSKSINDYACAQKNESKLTSKCNSALGLDKTNAIGTDVLKPKVEKKPKVAR